MLELVLYVIVTCVVAFGLVKLIDKFLPTNSRIIVSVVLWLICGFLAYLLYNSVMKPIRFKEAKTARYELAVSNMIDIKKSQLGYKKVYGEYADSFEKLEKFIETEKFAIVSRRDTAVVDTNKNALFGLTTGADGVGGYYKDIVIIDTLGFVSVKDSLFKNSTRYKNMGVVKTGNGEVKIYLETGFVERNDLKLPVFKASINKNDLLADLDQELVKQENKVKDINEIDGDQITLGSMQEITVTGNWPKKYGKND